MLAVDLRRLEELFPECRMLAGGYPHLFPLLCGARPPKICLRTFALMPTVIGADMKAANAGSRHAGRTLICRLARTPTSNP